MNDYKVGDKIKFEGEKQRYTVKARSERFLVCTKPFNARKTVLYCVVDFEENRRGPLDYVFSPFDFTGQEDCDRALEALLAKKAKVSFRHDVPLDIDIKAVIKAADT